MERRGNHRPLYAVTAERAMVALKEENSTVASDNASDEAVNNEESMLKKGPSKNEIFAVDHNNEDALFDHLMEDIGDDGKFQKRLDIIYNFIYNITLTMPFLNIVLALTVPNHWCHVPGQEFTNYTVDDWKEKWLPKENKSGENTFSSCQMYLENETERTAVGCQHGWEFDRQWYTETIPTEENWVCDREIYVANALAAGRIGEIIGTFVFGLLGDSHGRKPVFYASIIVLVTGRMLSVFTSAYYHIFLFSVALGSMCSLSVFQSALVISMEISAERKRSHIAFLQCAGWVTGLCIMSFIAWVVKDWKLILMITTLPNIVCFCTYKLLPESPRWLAYRGRIDEAVAVLKYIARVNQSKIPENTYKVLEKIKNKKENFYGVAGLFMNWWLAKNTLMIVVCWTVAGLGYYIITLSVTGMSGNPFLNFFLQSLVELPGYYLGKILSDKIGRRWTHAGACAFGCVFCAGVILTQTFNLKTWIIVMVTLVKLTLTTSFYIVWLRTMEIYPTCIRQTGTSFGGTVSNIIGITGSYIVYLGVTTDTRLPYCILLGLILMSCLCSTFLPETLHKKLPETLEDGKTFGRDQKYWAR